MNSSEASDRRGFVLKVVAATASVGVAGLTLDRFMGRSMAQASDLTIDSSNTGSGTTSLSSPGNPGLAATNTSNGAALQGTSTVGTGVYGTTTSGTGVGGVASDSSGTGVQGFASSGGTGVVGLSSSGVGVKGQAGDSTAIPFVAQAADGQTANLQEWQKNDGTVLAEMDASGRLGIGTSAPNANFHAVTDSGTGVEGDSTSGTGVTGRSGNIAVFGYCSGPSGSAVQGNADSVTGYSIGVWGLSKSGTGVSGEATGPTAKPIVAKGTSGQTASLQEWQNSAGNALSVVDPSGRFGVGTGSPIAAVQVIRPAAWANADPLIRLDGDTYNVGGFFYAYGTGNFPFFSGRRSRGSQASPSAVQSGDLLMRYGGAGYGTNAFPSGNRAMLDFYAAENWTNTAQGTYVSISTTATGASAPTEKMRVTGDGSVLPPSDNTGSIGKVGQRWSLVRAQTITSGDLTFENGYRVTEDEESGLRFLNEDGQQIAKLDHEGNIHIKGDIIKDL